MDFYEVQLAIGSMVIFSAIGLVVAFFMGKLGGRFKFLSVSWVLFVIVVIATRVIAFGGPSGEARLTIEDGTYEVKSVVSYTDGPAELGPVGGHYDLLLVEENGDTRLYRFSADVVGITDSNKREATVVSKQGLRNMTILFPMDEIGG